MGYFLSQSPHAESQQPVAKSLNANLVSIVESQQCQRSEPRPVLAVVDKPFVCLFAAIYIRAHLCYNYVAVTV